MSKNKGFKKFVLGAAIGAGLGVLFAPKKGSETRAILKNKFDELMIEIKKIDKWNDEYGKEMAKAKIKIFIAF